MLGLVVALAFLWLFTYPEFDEVLVDALATLPKTVAGYVMLGLAGRLRRS